MRGWYQIFADGASRCNPGHSSIGVVSFLPDKPLTRDNIVFKIKKYIGKQTNNQAEYQSLIFALGECVRRKILNCRIYMDSQLVIRQVEEKYKVRNKNLKPLFLKVKELERDIKELEYFHISREENKIADQLANDALDEYLIKKSGRTYL